MTTVHEVLKFLFELAPESMKEEWDHVGLQWGHLEAPVHRVLVALDPFQDVLEEAVEQGAELIVAHHPLLFHPVYHVTDEDAVGRVLLRAAETGCAIISMHTNLDAAPGGVNDCLAQALGLEQVQVLSPAGTDGQGRTYGIGRVGTVPQTDLRTFAGKVKTALGCGGVRIADAGRPVRKVAVGGGACGEFTRNAWALGCDTFVTADLKYNGFYDGVDLGMNLIDAGHFPTENLVCAYLQKQLQLRFEALTVEISKRHRDVIAFL